MADASIKVHSEVFTRDAFARFQEHCLEASRKTAEDAAKEGARVARARATKKSGAMAATIHATNASGAGVAMMAEIRVGTDHWRYQESGTAPHSITGLVNFYWEARQRKWQPGPNNISHPGNRAVHFMVAGYEAAEEKLKEGMQRNYRLDAGI